MLGQPIPSDYYDYLISFVEGRGPPEGSGGGGSGGGKRRSWAGAVPGAGFDFELGLPLAERKDWHLDQLGVEGVYDMDAEGPLAAVQ